MVINLTLFTKEDEEKLLCKGVYLIEHDNTSLKYVGSTKTTFKCRWKNHIKAIRRNTANKVLLNIYNKYGIDGFKFSILEIINSNDVSYIRQRERYWIEKLDTYKKGANCTLNTESALYDSNLKHHKYTEEEKLELRKNSPNKKTVYLYDENGVLINTFCSTVECDRFLGLEKRRTNWAINHFQSLKKKYYPSYELKEWCPKKEKEKIKKESAQKAAITRKNNGYNVCIESQKNKIRMNNPKRKQVALYDLDGNFIRKFNSLNECDDYLKLYRGTTSKVFRGLTKVLRKKYIPKLI